MVYSRLIQPPAQSFFLFGMRGVGKSTWARANLPNATTFDLLDERLFQDLLAEPALFAQAIEPLGPGSWVVVDEVQRLPALLNDVHRAIEAKRLRFALLGSSARKLKAAGVNLLAGRALKRTMFPLSPAKLGRDFDLQRVLRFGSVPLIWMNEAPAQALVAAPVAGGGGFPAATGRRAAGHRSEGDGSLSHGSAQEPAPARSPAEAGASRACLHGPAILPLLGWH